MGSRPGSANVRESDGSVTHVSPGFVRGNPLRQQAKQAAKSRRPRNVTVQADAEAPCGLAQVVAAGPPYWQLFQRECQSRDLGHPCKGCGVPLTELGTTVWVWRAATFIKRFHPDCAETFNGHSPTHNAAPSYAVLEANREGVLDQYADGWRRASLSDTSVQRAEERRVAREQRQRWPLYPTAGMLWRAGTLALQQERRDAQGVEAWKRQMAALHKFTKACGGVQFVLEEDSAAECAICLGGLEMAPAVEIQNEGGQTVILLPCDPSHAFHTQCLEPWLKKNFHCPKCRADLRPLLNPQVAKGVAESIRAAGHRAPQRLLALRTIE